MKRLILRQREQKIARDFIIAATTALRNLGAARGWKYKIDSLNAAPSLWSSLPPFIHMILRAILVLIQGVTFLAFAATIGAPANQNAEPHSLQLLPDMTEPASYLVAAKPGPHMSLSNTNLTFDEPQCSDEMGTNLNLASCRNVVSNIPRSLGYITLGWRGRGHFDLTLPYIYASGMKRGLKLASSTYASPILFLISGTVLRMKQERLADFALAPSHPDDGACAVYVAPKATLQPDVFTFTGISENAQRIIQKCVVDPSIGSGGIVTGLGMLNCVCFAKGGFDDYLLVLEPLSRRFAGCHGLQPWKLMIQPNGLNAQSKRHANERINSSRSIQRAQCSDCQTRPSRGVRRQFGAFL